MVIRLNMVDKVKRSDACSVLISLFLEKKITLEAMGTDMAITREKESVWSRCKGSSIKITSRGNRIILIQLIHNTRGFRNRENRFPCAR